MLGRVNKRTNLSNKHITVQTSVKVFTLSLHANLKNDNAFGYDKDEDQLNVNTKI